MNEHAQSFCLNVIVKNEARVIRLCLDSVRPIIDYWVIVDTGSTDGTQEAIRQHLDGLPGELIERPWVDFAHNRSEAVALARMRAGSYCEMPYCGAMMVSSMSTRVVTRPVARNSFPMRGSYRTATMLDRSRGPQSCLRDAQTLEKAIRDEPNNARYAFYLAETYLLLGDFDSALSHYRRRVGMGGHNDEVWFSLYRIAQLDAALPHRLRVHAGPGWSAVPRRHELPGERRSRHRASVLLPRNEHPPAGK